MNNNQRFVLVLAAMILIGVAIMRTSPAQQATPAVLEKVTAKQFVLVDDKGTPRARLQMEYGANPQMVLLGENQETLADITGITDRGGVVELKGGKGQEHVVLGHGPLSSVRQDGVALKRDPIGNPGSDYFLDFYDDAGSRVARYADGYIKIWSSPGSIVLVDKNGKPHLVAGMDEAGNPTLSMTDQNGKKRVFKP